MDAFCKQTGFDNLKNIWVPSRQLIINHQILGEITNHKHVFDVERVVEKKIFQLKLDEYHLEIWDDHPAFLVLPVVHNTIQIKLYFNMVINVLYIYIFKGL